MPRFMLDADTVSYAIRGQGQVAARLLQHRPSELCVSSITLAELKFGAEAKRSQKLRRAIRAFATDVAVVPFDEAAAAKLAELRARKIRIGTQDLRIAAIVLSIGGVLITSNRRDFEQVAGLEIEDWTIEDNKVAKRTL